MADDEVNDGGEVTVRAVAGDPAADGMTAQFHLGLSLSLLNRDAEAMARNSCRSESTDGLQPCINKWEAERNLLADSKFNRVGGYREVGRNSRIDLKDTTG